MMHGEHKCLVCKFKGAIAVIDNVLEFLFERRRGLSFSLDRQVTIDSVSICSVRFYLSVDNMGFSGEE